MCPQHDLQNTLTAYPFMDSPKSLNLAVNDVSTSISPDCWTSININLIEMTDGIFVYRPCCNFV